MAMSKYRIKEGGGGYIVVYLKYVGGGYVWEQTGRKYSTRDEAQAYINELRGADNASKH